MGDQERPGVINQAARFLEYRVEYLYASRRGPSTFRLPDMLEDTTGSKTAAQLVAEAKQEVENLTVDQVTSELATGVPLLVDLREPAERAEGGAIAGSVHAPRGMLEFYADPSPASGTPHTGPADVRCPLPDRLAAGSAHRSGVPDSAPRAARPHATRPIPHPPRHFGPLSGSEPKLAEPVQRYILTAFTFGCSLGPAQAARHLQGLATAHELSFTNRRHVSVDELDAVIKDLVNAYHRCDLPKVWGSGSSASADGTRYDLAENSLLAEYSIRYAA